jgi:hypothetical protein
MYTLNSKIIIINLNLYKCADMREYIVSILKNIILHFICVDLKIKNAPNRNTLCYYF